MNVKVHAQKRLKYICVKHLSFMYFELKGSSANQIKSYHILESPTLGAINRHGSVQGMKLAISKASPQPLSKRNLPCDR